MQVVVILLIQPLAWASALLALNAQKVTSALMRVCQLLWPAVTVISPQQVRLSVIAAMPATSATPPPFPIPIWRLTNAQAKSVSLMLFMSILQPAPRVTTATPITSSRCHAQWEPIKTLPLHKLPLPRVKMCLRATTMMKQVRFWLRFKRKNAHQVISVQLVPSLRMTNLVLLVPT